MDGTCVVVWAAVADAARAAGPGLSVAEHARTATFRRSEDRDRFVAGARLLRAAVAAVAAWPVQEVRIVRSCPHCGSTLHGRPVVERPGGLYVSVTHAGDLAGVAVTAVGPVGVDAEEIAELDLAGTAAAVVGPRDTVPANAEQLLRLWTAKEAAAKALGTGFAHQPTDIEVTDGGGAGARVRFAHDQVDARLLRLRPPDREYVARLVVLTRDEVAVEQRCMRFTPIPVRRAVGRVRDDTTTGHGDGLSPRHRSRLRRSFATAAVPGVLRTRVRT